MHAWSTEKDIPLRNVRKVRKGKAVALAVSILIFLFVVRASVVVVMDQNGFGVENILEKVQD